MKQVKDWYDVEDILYDDRAGGQTVMAGVGGVQQSYRAGHFQL